MEKLNRLELSDNKIGAYSESHLELIAQFYPNLRVLKISNNGIKTMEEIKELAKCEKLESLDISNNPLCSTEGYTDKVRELLPSLDVLDGFNKEGAEVVSEDESEEGDEDEEEGDDDEEAASEEGEEEGEEGEDDEEDEDEEEGDEEEESKEANDE